MEMLSTVPSIGLSASQDASARVRTMVDEHFDFVWRSVRRLGVREADADDAAQRVFWVAARKVDGIEPGREKAFLFGTAMRVASHVRRSYRVCRETSSEELGVLEDSAPWSDVLVDQRRARALADHVLETMPEDLRAALILHEVEGLTTPEIAELLGIALGTAASRLRRARERFETSVRTFLEQRGPRGAEP